MTTISLPLLALVLGTCATVLLGFAIGIAAERRVARVRAERRDACDEAPRETKAATIQRLTSQLHTTERELKACRETMEKAHDRDEQRKREADVATKNRNSKAIGAAMLATVRDEDAALDDAKNLAAWITHVVDLRPTYRAEVDRFEYPADSLLFAWGPPPTEREVRMGRALHARRLVPSPFSDDRDADILGATVARVCRRPDGRCDVILSTGDLLPVEDIRTRATRHHYLVDVHRDDAEGLLLLEAVGDQGGRYRNGTTVTRRRETVKRVDLERILRFGDARPIEDLREPRG